MAKLMSLAEFGTQSIASPKSTYVRAIIFSISLTSLRLVHFAANLLARLDHDSLLF